MQKEGLLAWLGKVTNRHDIGLISAFPKDIESLTFEDEMEVVFSSRLASSMGLSVTEWGVAIGIPLGDFWEELSQLKFEGFEVLDTPRNLTSANFLRLRYQFEFSMVKTSKSRYGKNSKYETKLTKGSLLFPVSRWFAKKVRDSDVIDFLAMQSHDKHYRAVEKCEPLSVNQIGKLT